MTFSGIRRGEATAVRGGEPVVVRVPGRIEFVVAGVDVSYVNGLRRSLIGDVVTAAVEFDPNDPDRQGLRVVRNTGVLHNEMIGSRVSLMPVHLTRAELSGLDPSAVALSLDVTNDGDAPLHVTTRDVAVAGGGLNRDRVFPSDPVTGDWPLITTLMPRSRDGSPGQSLSFTAALKLGTGREHARHCPVAACAAVPVVDEDRAAAARATSSDKATFDAVERPHLWLRGEGGAPAAHRFSLETICGVPPEDLVLMGFEALSARMSRLADRLADPGSAEVGDEEPMRNSPDVAGVKLLGETDTAGALIQAHLLGESGDGRAQEGSSYGSCDFCGYFTPHPLDQCIIVRMRPSAAWAAARGPRALLEEACRSVAVRARQLGDDWARASSGLE